MRVQLRFLGLSRVIMNKNINNQLQLLTLYFAWRIYSQSELQKITTDLNAQQHISDKVAIIKLFCKTKSQFIENFFRQSNANIHFLASEKRLLLQQCGAGRVSESALLSNIEARLAREKQLILTTEKNLLKQKIVMAAFAIYAIQQFSILGNVFALMKMDNPENLIQLTLQIAIEFSFNFKMGFGYRLFLILANTILSNSYVVLHSFQRLNIEERTILQNLAICRWSLLLIGVLLQTTFYTLNPYILTFTLFSWCAAKIASSYSQKIASHPTIPDQYKQSVFIGINIFTMAFFQLAFPIMQYKLIEFLTKPSNEELLFNKAICTQHPKQCLQAARAKLGITEAESPEQVKKAYRQRILLTHADKHRNDDRAYWQSESQQINSAYEILKPQLA